MNTDDILKKYSAKIEKDMRGFDSSNLSGGKYSHSYETFKSEMVPSFSRYEKWCKALGGVFKMKVSEKDRAKIEKEIETAHLDLSASEVSVFSIVVLMGVLFGGLLALIGGWLLLSDGNLASFPIMFAFLIFLLSIFLFYYTYTTPARMAMQWRLKASSQMVPAILYIVVYMKHTSNFEKAVAFAAEHLTPPLSLDFRKIFWDVEVGRFSSIKESIDHYLESWRDYSIEFIEAFHLIESSLYEPSESRRVQTLERSLQVILDGVYDKMLKYTHDVKSPLTNVYMLGIVLPTLALAILPLASTMLQGAVKAYHVFVIFDILVPFLVFYMTTNVMMARPGGFGDSSLIEMNPLYPKYKSKKPYLIAFFIVLPFLLLGFLPILWAHTPLSSWLGMQREYYFNQIGLDFLGSAGVFGIFSDDAGNVIAGPHGAVSLLLSLLIPFSLGFFFIIAYKMKTKELIKSRDMYKEVEKEFTSSLFQLGNRLGDGTPAEIAFSKVSESTKGTATEGFFRIVNENIQQLGMSLDQALFNPRRGAAVFYPSPLISISMKILIESVKKGLKVAAHSLMSISEYVKNIKKIDDRLNDLLADIISDMKSNMIFLAPLLSGIVVGLSGMITSILGGLTNLLAVSGGDSEELLAGAGGMGNLLGMFDIHLMMPVYWLQVIIGVYLVEIVFILTSTLVTIKSGRDILQQTAETGKNLRSCLILYIVIAIFAIVGLTLLGTLALSGLG